MKTSFVQPLLILLASLSSAIYPGAAQAQAPRPAPRLALQYVVAPRLPPHTASRAALDSQATRKLPDSLSLQVSVELPAGWHINSETPPDSFLVPTRLEAEAQGVQFGKPKFPAPELVFSPAMGEKLPLYSGTVAVVIPVLKSPGGPSKPMPVTRVVLHYQACNDQMCLPPRSVTVEQ
jgi:hypothetical protein